MQGRGGEGKVGSQRRGGTGGRGKGTLGVAEGEEKQVVRREGLESTHAQQIRWCDGKG